MVQPGDAAPVCGREQDCQRGDGVVFTSPHSYSPSNTDARHHTPGILFWGILLVQLKVEMNCVNGHRRHGQNPQRAARCQFKRNTSHRLGIRPSTIFTKSYGPKAAY